MRSWLVGGALIEGPEGLLLVQNRRRDGSLDWTTPGGVIEVHEGETVQDGLAREVARGDRIVVTEWEGPVYEVECRGAPGWAGTCGSRSTEPSRSRATFVSPIPTRSSSTPGSWPSTIVRARLAATRLGA